MLQVYRPPKRHRAEENDTSPYSMQPPDRRFPLAEAELYPSSGLPPDVHYSVDEWLMDSRYHTLNAKALAWLLHVCKNDGCVRTVCEIYFSMLFAGGVTFEREGYDMDETSKRWFNDAWQAWFADVERQKKSVGFAACRALPHSIYVGKPTCIDLTQCLILYRLDVNSIPHFVFFEISTDPGSLMGNLTAGAGDNRTFMNYTYLEGVVVYVEQPPSNDCVLASTIASLAADLQVHRSVMDALMTATRLRAAPPLVTQSVSMRQHYNSLVAPRDRMSRLRLGTLHGDGTAPAEKEADAEDGGGW